MFSLILPAYNESQNLERCVLEAVRLFRDSNIRYEIIIAEDGSTDGTDRLAAMLSRKHAAIKHLHSKRKLGKGLAIRRAMETAKGSAVGVMDVDLSTDIAYLKKLLKYSSEYDIVTGSRYMKGSVVKRPVAREIVSRSYNVIANILLGTGVMDLQCGFKAFSRKFIDNEVKCINEKTWAWDTVAILVARKKGYSIKEFPVSWEEKKEKMHSASPKRILSDIKIHGKVLAKLFLKFRLGMNINI